MGSASVLEPAMSTDEVDLNGKRLDLARTTAMIGKERKRTASRTTEESTGTRKIPRRAAACLNFKEKSVSISDKDSVIEKKEDQTVEEEAVAVRLTAGLEVGKPSRNLTEFVLHNSDGIPQSFEMLEVDDIFISGLILPLEAQPDKKKLRGIKCESFGRVESWAISGYEDGVPVIWLSTDIADYNCIKPSGSYKKLYDHFFAKATTCVEVYKKLSKSSGGNPDTSLDELLGGACNAMEWKCFPRDGHSVRDFYNSSRVSSIS
ncbi:hypothetical protein Leryth_021882 [Lithospermum erythrorhizon]|nr:hypothetical protein Leryth_021882 [Lithospermum erythrorhizon]